MREVFAAWRTVAEISAITGLSAAALIGLTLVALYVPGFRTLAIRTGVCVALLYAGLLAGGHLGRTEIRAEWDAANVRAERDRVTRDAEIKATAEQDFTETITQQRRALAARKQTEDGYASTLLGQIAAGVTARCELGADAVRLRNAEARAGGPAEKPRRRHP